MKTRLYRFLSTLLICTVVFVANARENVNSGEGHREAEGEKIMGGCIAGKTQTELMINNVRTRILTDGDMWWDLSNAKYEIPKGSGSMAQFAGSLWFGGYHGSVLAVSAMTYRQCGIDFWPGPLDPITLSIDASTCTEYDRHWVFNRQDVDNFYAYFQAHGQIDPNTPAWIKDYPGTYQYPTTATVAGVTELIYYLAPFNDLNANNVYDYGSGDYPNYNVTGLATPRGQCVRRLFGDETIFYVFNDEGNKHGETGATQNIGVEIRMQAFEFSTGDELNDMSFYNYEVINWSTTQLDSAYFTVWDDCDLGNFQDDWIGCDVGRGMGYQYNGDTYDNDNAGIVGYHDKLPAIGCDFFQGPYADLGDKLDNDRDGCVDCSWPIGPAGGGVCTTCAPIPDNILPEQCIMSRFTYYINAGNAFTGNPSCQTPQQYYNFMNGVWRNGSPMTYGGVGTTGTQTCLFLFPGTTDPLGWGLGYQPVGGLGNLHTAIAAPAPYNVSPGWDAATGGLLPFDMRFLQSAGKFTLKPGALNYLTYGIPFARTTISNDQYAPIPLLQAADDKAQSLFDNCFKILDGPDAPDLTFEELSQQFLVTMTNSPFSNNYEGNRYHEADPTIQIPLTELGHAPDQVYRFEGYIIYQLIDGTVGPSDLYNADKARQVFQCDIKNGVTKLINYNVDQTLGNVPQLMVSGLDQGIENSFTLTKDAFSVTAGATLTNFRNYYFMAVAYAYNNYLTYVGTVSPSAGVDTTAGHGHSASNPGILITDPSSGDLNGQKKPYLQGRRNIKVYTAIPHDPSPEQNGTIMNSSYGVGPAITRIEGQGNGGFPMDLTDQSVTNILNSPINRSQQLNYIANRGPINVKVTDPLKVVKGNFVLKFVEANKVPVGSDSLWEYTNNPPIAMPTNTSAGTLDTGKVAFQNKMRWYLTGTYNDALGNSVSKTWLSDEGINVGQEKIITGLSNEPLGFSITIKQVFDPQAGRWVGPLSTGYQVGLTQSTDLLEADLTFANPGTPWLSGVQDLDGDPTQDWIASGGNTGSVYMKTIQGKTPFVDPQGIWQSMIGGTWAPWRFIRIGLSAAVDQYPGYAFSNAAATGNDPGKYYDMRLNSSVDVVFTSDQSRWSRCPVIDMNPANKWNLRKALSLDLSFTQVATAGVISNNISSPNYLSDSSFSWFPGYAIDIETGERLNIIFSENSADTANRGTDMIWNPTSTIKSGSQLNIPNFGGMHYIYVFGHNADGNYIIGNDTTPSDVRRYDGGVSIAKMLKKVFETNSIYNYIYPVHSTAQASLLSEVFKDIMWVNLPVTAKGYNITNPHGIPCDAKVRIRVPKPYRYGLSTTTSTVATSYNGASVFSINLSYLNSPLDNNSNVNTLPEDIVANPQNNNFPMYSFSTSDLIPTTYNLGTAQKDLARINVVPNPYYGHDQYEATRIDNLIKIINLPVSCTVRIYNMAGTLVRTIVKDNSDTYITWDLKNQANIQIASGLYIIHVNAPGIGERILKWFGVLRPYDLQSY